MTERATTPAASRPDERRVITVLVADLVGSTRLAERMEPEDTRLVIGEAIARMVTAVEQLGGHVKDLAGDGVLAFFGAPVAHEDDAQRAVHAGLTITREMATYAAEIGEAWGVTGFAVRVAVNTGPVVVGEVGAGGRVEYAAFGDTVNTAARLQAEARPGTVLAAAATRRLAETAFRWGAPADHLLRGHDAVTTAYEVDGTVEHRAPAEDRTQLTPLIGRDQELRVAGEALDEVRSGAGAIVFVTGEPGIGKSRLLLELRSLFHARRPQRGRSLWLEGRCVSYGESLAYWPYQDLLRDLLGVGRDQPELKARVALRRLVDELFGDRSGDLYPYLAVMLGLSLEGNAKAKVAHLSPEALRYRTFEVVGQLIARLARDGPVAVVLDDQHWADATSLSLTDQLLALADEEAVLLVLAQRTERDHGSWSILDHARREWPHRTRELALEALSGAPSGSCCTRSPAPRPCRRHSSDS
ncbi:MAG: AAA family ATPase [Candidatus Limnocylindria bacterium]